MLENLYLLSYNIYSMKETDVYFHDKMKVKYFKEKTNEKYNKPSI